MKNIFIVLIVLVALFQISCSQKYYKYQTDDFQLFRDTTIDLSLQQKLQKFDQGMYLMQISAKDTIMFGNYTEWYELNGSENLKQYAFLVFLDDYRVYYYTVFDKEMVDSVQLLTTPQECYNPVRNPNEAYSHVFDRFSINYNTYPYSMRGYYRVEKDIPLKDPNLTPALQDKYYIDYVDLELEKYTAANRKAIIKLMLLEDKKTGEQQLVMISFRLASSKESEVRYKPTDISKRGVKHRNIILGETLDFPPTFIFKKKPVHFYWCPCDGDKHCKVECYNDERDYFNRIDYVKSEKSIRYFCNDEAIREESYQVLESKSFLGRMLQQAGFQEAQRINFQTW